MLTCLRIKQLQQGLGSPLAAATPSTLSCLRPALCCAELCALRCATYSPALQGSVKLLLEDVKELRPTLFIAVPRVLERISDGVKQRLQKARLAAMGKGSLGSYSCLALAHCMASSWASSHSTCCCYSAGGEPCPSAGRWLLPGPVQLGLRLQAVAHEAGGARLVSPEHLRGCFQRRLLSMLCADTFCARNCSL